MLFYLFKHFFHTNLQQVLLTLDYSYVFDP